MYTRLPFFLFFFGKARSLEGLFDVLSDKIYEGHMKCEDVLIAFVYLFAPVIHRMLFILSSCTMHNLFDNQYHYYLPLKRCN